ncbi:helix-turn-helix transcriptional regulator [Morganella morganii]|uniref:helix-turn-helix transcriptional regulator n=1 Tax=Morganella morganii TaxID=582 RepID=UPI0025C90674|nr:helix-turn-helix transcriptional regulator [Morganella morganii]
MNNIKQLRLKAGATQQEIAELIGCTRSALSHYEKGRRYPSITLGQKIVRALCSFGVETSMSEVFPPALDHDDQKESMDR